MNQINSIKLTVSSAQMLGGLHDEKPADEEVRKIVTSVQGQLEKEAKEKYKSLEPISYRKQIVAGANYFVKVSDNLENILSQKKIAAQIM